MNRRRYDDAGLRKRPQLVPWPAHALFVLCAVLLIPQLASAHPEGFSGLHVMVNADSLRAAITIHTRDMTSWFPAGRYPNYVADVSRSLEKTVGELVELRIDDDPLPIQSVKAFSPEVGLIEIDVAWTIPSLSKPAELLVWSKHLIHLPRGHQQLLFVEDRRAMAADAEHGVLRLEDTLGIERDASAVTLPLLESKTTQGTTASITSPPLSNIAPPDAEPVPETRVPKSGSASEHSSVGISFFLFGLEHIVTGYDHLLFLAALLLTCATFREAAAIITCFTVAHSITLALAAFDIVRLPAEIVEPAIAFSIVYVALENVFGSTSIWHRAGITCFFGLVHGLGFASALRDIGLGTIPGGVVLPLLKFNLGVEAGQLCIAAVFLPLLLLMRRNEWLSRRLVPAGSLAVAAMGAYWFIARIMPQVFG